MSGQIFISYRREESKWSARSLHDRLCRNFDPKEIFMDIDAIALGEDFVKAIETTVAKCDVLIAIIGNNWLTSKDDHGDRRLDNPEDFVHMEIATALKREIRVIPVLVDGALMPRSTDLPDDLKPLVRRNALRITDASFDGDCRRLVTAIEEVFKQDATEQHERQLEKERLGAEQREKEYLEAKQREKQRLDAEQLGKERLDAEQSERQRLVAQQLEKERLQTEKVEELEKERLQTEQRGSAKFEPQQSQTLPASSPDPIGQNGTLRLLQKWSFLPFGLVLVLWFFLPFSARGNFFQQGPFIVLLFFALWPIVVLCLHFFAFGPEGVFGSGYFMGRLGNLGVSDAFTHDVFPAAALRAFNDWPPLNRGVHKDRIGRATP
jgi:hypothetical protein